MLRAQVIAWQKTCVDFRADRWYPVANATIQHMVKVYDYYEPGEYRLLAANSVLSPSNKFSTVS